MHRPHDIDRNQLVIPARAELVAENEHPGIENEQRISLARLIGAVGTTITFGAEPTVQDYAHAEAGFINRGLYIHRSDDRFATAQHMVTLGVGPNNAAKTVADFGVVFPSNEFPIVARNSRDLARHTVNTTRRARLDRLDRDETTAAAMRSAGHALIAKMDSQRKLSAHLAADLADLRILYKDLVSPVLTTRYYAKNLDKKRVIADERIHETAEVAMINIPDINSAAVTGLHKTLRKKLYGGNYSSTEITYNWMRILAMTGTYIGARIHKIDLSHTDCASQLTQYQPYIESKRQLAATA
jgi:hypothetical protein